MGDRHDYVALEWVKGEIAETLKQARHALEAFVENPQDSTRMRFCLTYVHQVHGTLQMVEFFGAALLAEEMEQLARALLDERVTNQGEALEVMMQAILQLPAYLDRIQSARRDLPMVVLPLLNDLRAARGEKLLSETSLFSPDLSGRTPALSQESVERLRTNELPTLLRKLRQMLQTALVGVIRSQDLPTNLGYMARVFARLEMLCKDAPLAALWQIASGMVEGLASGEVSNGTSVRTLLRQVDKQLKRLVEEGADGLNQAAPDELIKNLLFYVAKAPGQTPRIQALKQQYRLDEALPDSAVVDQERAQLAGPDRGAMRSVVAALCEELVRVKDSLDLFVRSDRKVIGDLAGLEVPLKQIADTLAVLGFAQPRKIVLDQIVLVQSVAQGQQAPDDAVLMDIAGALLYVEATLAGMVGGPVEERNEATHLPTTDVAQIHQLVIREARNGLEQAKDAIIEFIASQWNHEHLARVPELLTQVRGGLAMIPLERAAALLQACNGYIQDQLLARKAVPDWQSLDTLADAITSVEYYLERLSEDCGSQGDLILDVAEESLQNLGYSLGRAQPEQSEATPSEPELSDPLDEIEVLPEEPDANLDAFDFAPAAEEDIQTLAPPVNASTPAPLLDSSTSSPINSEEAEPESAWVIEDLPSDEDIVFSLPEDVPLSEVTAVANQDAVLSDGSEAQLAELDLPEVTLPEYLEPEPSPAADPEPVLSLEQVMATPVAAINPPAQDVPPSLLPPPVGEEPVDEDLLEVFIEEAAEVLETIGEQLPRWFADTEDKEALGEVRRAFHTLKGSGRMVRALIIGELAWSIENLLNRVLDRSIQVNDSVKQVITEVVALMPALVDEFAAKAQRQRDDVDQLAAAAHALAKGQPAMLSQPAEQPAAPAAELMPVDLPADDDALDPQLLEIFRNEAEAHLTTLVSFLADCAQRLPQPVTDSLQRALHTLKGSAHMAGILPVAEIATPLEKMVKEFKTNLIQMDLAEAELLHEAELLLRQGLANLDHEPLAPIDGAPAFLAKVQALHQARLVEAGARQQNDAGETRDPNMIALFLSEGMDILLDAEDLLRSWREHPAERQELSALLEELNTLGQGAKMADLPQMEALCQVLLRLYAVVEEGRLAVSERFFEDVEQGHEALVGMMDQVAAALQVSEQSELVARLESLLAQAIDPSALEQSFAVVGEPEPLAFPSDASPTLMPAEAEAEAEAEAWPVEQAPVDEAQDELDQEMVEIFLDEAVDLMESAGHALDRWLADPANQMALSALLRDLHTLKGGARMAAIRPIGDLAHELESLYEGLSDGRYDHSPALATLLQRSHDHLALQLEQLQRETPMSCADALIESMQAFRQGVLPVFEPVEPADATQPEAVGAPFLNGEMVTIEYDVAEHQHEPLLSDSIAISLEDEEFSEAESEGPQAEPEAIHAVDASLDDYLDEIELSVPGEDETPASSQDISVPVQNEDIERDPELVEIFLEEGFDLIESAAGGLQRWMANVDNSLELEALQRDLHTLKGGARMADIREIGDLSHELEFLYEGLCAGNYRASSELFGLLQRCQDRLAEMLEAVRAHQPVPTGEALIETIRSFRSSPEEQLSIPSSVSLKAAQDDAQQSDETEILDIFVEEADDLLEEMESALGRWDAGREDAAPLADMLRVLHTLKGGARLAGQTDLGNMAHDLEQMLGEAQQQGAPWPDSLFLDVQQGYDALLKDIEHLRAGLSEDGGEDFGMPQPDAQDMAPSLPSEPLVLAQPIVAASTQRAPSSSPAKVLPFIRRAQQAAQEAASRRAPQELVKVPADLLEGLVNLAGETSIFRGRVEQQVSDVGFTLGEMEATIERVRDQLRRLDTETQAQILSRYQAEAERAGYDDFDPLEMDRHSQLQQLSRALFESASDLLDLKETLAARNRDAETLLLQQARVNTELQEGLMRTRMVPFERLVPRLRRIVRQVAGELGKQVEFMVGNATGEMDRSVLERIVAPLEHMLRNAVDHGIESVERRRAAGKPEQGVIRLDLAREGGDIVLTLADDGAGINLDAVRRKAVERGLMAADSDLSEHEILQFILEAGFSTAERVTQISGRGVGMDVVHSEVKQLGGSMAIESTLGQGTRFLIRLPFTVSVNRALMVYSGEDLYAIPLNTIEGIVRVSPYELEAYYQPDAPRFEYAGQAYELRYLGDLLNNGQKPKLVGQSLPLPVILVRSKEHSVAVQVDSLAGSREIVVKSLGLQFAGVHGISGATILGDGRVVVILDLLATIRVLHAHQLTQLQQPHRIDQAQEPIEVESERPTLVMVVDDSVTVRKVTSRLLERNGMNVLTAKDGVDAITQLQERKPDIMLLDIEMPRMDGFEVATLVRHDQRLKDLPIIMITSRTGEKHRDRALTIGVNEYLGKPYQESVLLEAIQRLVNADV